MSAVSCVDPQACYAGVDVSLEQLELCLLDAAASPLDRRVFPNNKAGVRGIIALCKGQKRPVKICLEPTSRYHEALALALASQPCCSLYLPNPRSVHDFASALSRRAKTDRCDAELLAHMALSITQPVWTPPSPAVTALNAIAVRLTQLTAMRTQEKNRLKLLQACPGTPAVHKSIKSVIAMLQRQGEALEQEALAQIRDDELLARRYQLLCSIPGIGQTSGIQLLAFLSLLPENLDKRQWVACAGLDPAPQDSGKTSKPRRISRRGSPRLRRALYMPALVATRFNPPLAEYYKRQLAKGKKPLSAISTIMVKLLHIIWALWKQNLPFDPDRQTPRTS